jgi:RimJ/RimL family protein N-acetyltransferase
MGSAGGAVKELRSMVNDLWHGELVHLTAENPATLAEAFVRWGRDSEYARLLDDGAWNPWSVKKVKEWIEKDLEKDPPPGYLFMVRTLDDDTMIGFVELSTPDWNHGVAWVGIGLGERAYWGKGYGTDAMRLILRYAFSELNLHRVSLDVFEYNPRALHSYQKSGFVLEGRQRQAILRDGRRWDILFMGILREEWEKQADRTPEQPITV